MTSGKKKTWKEVTLKWIYMPVWGLNDELRDAAAVLGWGALLQPVDEEELCVLGVDAAEREELAGGDVLGARSYVFGGAARGCLCLERATVKRLRTHVEVAIVAFEKCVGNAVMRAPSGEQQQSLCHWILPDPSSFTNYATEIASPFVAKRLQERMDKFDEAHQREFAALLLRVPSQLFRGMNIQLRARRTLANGVRFTARLLGTGNGLTQRKHADFDVGKSAAVAFAGTDVDLATLAGGPLFIPMIDSFYFVKQGVTDTSFVKQPDVLFFHTTAHPVKGEALVHVLKRLNLWDGRTTPSAALVFVVPLSEGSLFTRQPIVTTEAVAGNADVQQVKGIGRGIASVLKMEENIETVSQLDASASVHETVMRAKRALAGHRKLVEVIDDACQQILEEIPQYVWEL